MQPKQFLAACRASSRQGSGTTSHEAGAVMAGDSSQAIFIIGIEHRSGTNFLCDLLALHDDCSRPTVVGENFFLHHASWLRKYAQGLHKSWNQEWHASATQEQIGAGLGRGLLSILAEQATRPDGRLVTKTPRTDELKLYSWLFPEHPLLIIIRDGRSVVESAVRSFGWNYAEATDRWVRGARRILEFDRDERARGDRPSCRYLVVRYEDLVQNLEGELRRILAFLRLSPARYDFRSAIDMPVRGSSTLKTSGQKLHWTPVPKSQGFDPLNRARDWTPARQRTFLRAAGAYQSLLGYPSDHAPTAGVFGRLLDRLAASRQQRKVERLGLVPLQLQPAAAPGEQAAQSHVLPFRAQRRAA